MIETFNEIQPIGADSEKIIFLLPLITVVMSYLSYTSADDDDDG